MSETSTKPYLIRAIYEWCADNGYRPYIAVAVDEHTVVPTEFVRNGEIVLNVSADATQRLRMGNDLIEFEARFNRVARAVSIPIDNVTAIYAAENGHGMAFDVPKAPAVREQRPALESAPAAPPAAEAPRSPARLSAVDGRPAERTVVELAPVPVPTDKGAGAPEEPSPPSSPGGRPRLTRIK